MSGTVEQAGHRCRPPVRVPVWARPDVKL